MGMYKQPLLILFWETLTFWNPVAKFDIAPKNRCWTAAEYQYSVIYFISRKHQKKWENHFSLHQRDRWTPVSKFWAKLQFMVWDRGEREFPFPVIPYSLIVLGVSGVSGVTGVIEHWRKAKQMQLVWLFVLW